ncbi:MAG: Nif3-like dinuclear metal center hexameric protein [Solirubrobacteraceae bacterium]
MDHLEQLLDAATFEDYCPNGLQVAGRDDVRLLVSGVSAHLELLERARERGADLVLAHHGIFWKRDDPTLVGPHRARVALLLQSEMSLAAYHLPLDAHAEFGNNALLAAGLGAAAHEAFGDIGRGASFAGEGLQPEELRARTADLTQREPLMFDCGPPRIRRLAIVSGAGSGYFGAAIASGYDAFLTGEPTERVMAQARESGVHFIAAGHHATETLGVRALGGLIAQRFGIEHEYIDVPNPI